MTQLWLNQYSVDSFESESNQIWLTTHESSTILVARSTLKRKSRAGSNTFKPFCRCLKVEVWTEMSRHIRCTVTHSRWKAVSGGDRIGTGSSDRRVLGRHSQCLARMWWNGLHEPLLRDSRKGRAVPSVGTSCSMLVRRQGRHGSSVASAGTWSPTDPSPAMSASLLNFPGRCLWHLTFPPLLPLRQRRL